MSSVGRVPAGRYDFEVLLRTLAMRWARINTMEIDLKVGSLLVRGLYFTIYICVSAAAGKCY